MAELTRKQLLMAVVSGRGPAYLRGVDLTGLDLSDAGWLVEADLRDADLSRANLGRSNLMAAKLDNARLQGARLIGTSLEGASLRGANLNVANLMRANLRGADLYGARLIGANLTRADLQNADMEGADLEGADLQGANLNGARLDFANLKLADLRGVDMSAVKFRVGEPAPDAGVPRHGFNGTVHQVRLADIIQLLCLCRLNVVIDVQSRNGSGKFHIFDGRVRHAETETFKGEEAFFRMLLWENGRFETRTPQGDPEHSIDKPWEHLLVEAVRRYDEETAERTASIFRNIIAELRRYLPLPVFLAGEETAMPVVFDGDQSVALLVVTDAFEEEESGEIFCLMDAGGGETVIMPLRTLDVDDDHPLCDLIREYRHRDGFVAARR